MQDLVATVRGARPRLRAAEIIGRRIVSGGLLPGTILPNFDALAAAAFAPLIEMLLLIILRIQRDAHPRSTALAPAHAAILDAIKRGDGEAARRAATAHLERAETNAMAGISLLAPAGGGATARSMS